MCENKDPKDLYTEDLIALVQLSAEVSWPPCQDKRDEDSLPVLPSNDVESQACSASVNQNSTRLPANTAGQSIVTSIGL